MARATGFRALAIWLAIFGLGIALLFPLHITQIQTEVGKNVIEARPYDVKVTNYSDTTVLKTEILQYNMMPKPSTFASTFFDNLGIIWCALIIISLLALIIEYFRAEDLGRYNQFALLSLVTSIFAVLIFYFVYSSYLLAQFKYGFVETTSDHATGVATGFYGALVSIFLSFLVAMQGYTSKEVR